MGIGSNIRRLREGQRMTQEQLAEKLEVSFQAVSSWERDEYLPETANLMKLAAMLNVSASAILEEKSGVFKLKDEIYNWSHMKTYIKTTARNLKLRNTLAAVDLAVEKHEGQQRKRSSIPYIAHPLTLACHALAMGFADDEIVAACLLHDVVEDCGVDPEDMPVSEEVKEIVKLLSHKKTTDEDRDQVVARAREAGVTAIGVPGIDLKSCDTVLEVCRRYPGYCFPMLGLHPEEVRADWREVLTRIKPFLNRGVCIGEVGLDFYWSREFEREQIEAIEEQVRWSVELGLPLMIHCRKAQNEMVNILKRFKNQLPGGVFHCFTGNELEARELLQFDRFVLGIGGVLTFKKSKLPETLQAVVPLERIVLETDSPYMAPVPMRGQRNEPAFVAHVAQRLAETYDVSISEVIRQTDENCKKVLNISA